jgi:transcriptional/translational regulatory protein YebC/TACO1
MDAGAKIASAEIVKTSTQKINVNNEQREKVEKLIESLENYEDTIAVYTNANI